MQADGSVELRNRRHNLAVIDEIIEKTGYSEGSLVEVREFLNRRVRSLEQLN